MRALGRFAFGTSNNSHLHACSAVVPLKGALIYVPDSFKLQPDIDMLYTKLLEVNQHSNLLYQIQFGKNIK